MDSYVKTITLDVNADQNYTIVKAKQGDKINRKIAITLKKDGANFTPTGVSEIWFRVEKPDKNIAIVKSTDSGNPISVNGNVYTVSISEQCLTASGKAWCDLAFLDSSGNTLSSCAFILNIVPMPNGNTAESTSEWTELQKAIDDAERFADIVAFRTSGNYIQYTVDGQTWTNLVNVGAIGGDLQTQINERMLLAPDYTGATDLDSLCNYIKSLIENNESKYRLKIFAFNCTRERGAATGYFGTSSFTVICKYSSTRYGYGIMMSDDEKFIASFRTNNNTNYLYEIGDLKGSLNTLQGDITDLEGSLTSLDNEKVARSPTYVSSLTELDSNITSEFFIANADIAIGSTGVTIPTYSRCIFINSASADGALIAATIGGSIISAFRDNGTWVNAKINTPDSPTLTGTPTAPTAAQGTNTTQIATTAFVTVAIQALTGKSVSFSATAGANISTFEITAAKVCNVVNMYAVFAPTANLSFTGDVICSNLPYTPYTNMQITAFCIAGNHLGQGTRLLLQSNGQIQTHYSAPTPEAGETWITNTTYICN